MELIDLGAALIEQESVIQQALSNFLVIGRALSAIHEGRLFREHWSTFPDYCRVRWNLTAQHAYRLMDAAKVAEHVPVGNERTARPLARLTDDDQKLAWSVIEATAPGGKITARHVQSVVNVLGEMQRTGALDVDDGKQLPISLALQVAVTEESYERLMRQSAHLKEAVEQKTKERHTRVFEQRCKAADVMKVVAEETLKLRTDAPTAEVRIVIWTVEKKYD